MEIPVINRITDFEAGVASLQNPSFAPKIFALSSIGELILQASSFWKWGALIIALLASFTTVMSRIKTSIIRFQTQHLSSVSKPFLGNQQDYDSDTETDITSCSSVSEDDEEEEDDDDDDDDVSAPSSYSRRWAFGDEDFRVKGPGSGDCYIDEDWTNLFSTGKNVVNIWGNYIDFDMIKQQNTCSIFGSPSFVVSAETSVSGNSLKVWDTRVGGRIPQILADWGPRLGRIVGVYAAGGIEKIYVTDDASTGGLTVADGRKLGSPLLNAAEADMDTWWDADAVIVDDDSVDESGGLL